MMSIDKRGGRDSESGKSLVEPSYKVMTPGPVQVRENVRLARSLACPNPDLDSDFVEFYHETCGLISRLLHTENETLILGGEGILGLEAACASLTEPGDRVLVISNGIYGEGFADYVTMYRGNPDVYRADWLETINTAALAQFLERSHDYKYATVVHGDTPSGMLNHVETICPLLKQYGILTVVDSVSAMFGEDLRVDDWQMDVVCGGSQKVVSAPPGLTFVTLSRAAKEAIRDRRTPIASFYANLAVFAGYYEEKWFPYTMPVSDIYGLRAAFENIQADLGIRERHVTIGAACRAAVVAGGLSLHLRSGYSDTVTVFDVPAGLTDREILDRMRREHQILLAGSFGPLAGRVIRIGHMGENANEEDVRAVLRALQAVLQELGFDLQADMEEVFVKQMRSA